MTTPIREGMLKWIGDRKVLFDNLPASTPLCLKSKLVIAEGLISREYT